MALTGWNRNREIQEVTAPFQSWYDVRTYIAMLPSVTGRPSWLELRVWFPRKPQSRVSENVRNLVLWALSLLPNVSWHEDWYSSSCNYTSKACLKSPVKRSEDWVWPHTRSQQEPITGNRLLVSAGAYGCRSRGIQRKIKGCSMITISFALFCFCFVLYFFVFFFFALFFYGPSRSPSDGGSMSHTSLWSQPFLG